MTKIGDVQVHIEGPANSPNAETIVMLHGWPDTYRLWDAQVVALKDRYRCARYTLPGFEPGSERRARNLDELTGLMKQVIEQVSPGRKVILMLHDWGCVFGYQFYLRNPQLVSKIVGVDIGDPVSMRREATVATLLMVLSYQIPLALAWLIGGRIGDAITRFFARRIHCPTDPATIHSGMTYPYWLMWFAPARALRGQFREFRPDVPMLYMYAKRKPFMFHAQSWLEALRSRPDNKVVEFDTGHWVMRADPARFNQVVGDWLTATSRG